MFRSRTLLPALLALVLAALGSLLVAPSASADSQLLCTGFRGCAQAGYSNAGYARNYQEMWWRMYAGHNCTNYVAYRMVRAGMSTTRPWSGSGNASNWGVALADRTDRRPIVGSVAWWSSGHVAYVEAVVDTDTVVLSEDHYGGDFDWRVVTRGSGSWPTGFIHLRDVRVASLIRPDLADDPDPIPQVGVALSALPGSWSRPADYRYQWYAGSEPISGATAATFVPTPDQVGLPLQVRVRARAFGYLTGTRRTVVSAQTAPGVMAPTTEPAITGLAKVTGTLTVSGAGWAPVPDQVAVQWLADGVPISGATGTTFSPGPDQLGAIITAAVTGTRTGYQNATQVSAGTDPVLPENLEVVTEPRLRGRPITGRTLRVDLGEITPAAEAAFTWLRDGVPIPDATGPSYQLGEGDPGHWVSVRVTYSRPGYTSVVRTLERGTRVQSIAQVRLVSLEHRQVTVRMRALDVDQVRGTVSLVNAGGRTVTGTLRNGQVSFVADWIRTGDRSYTVLYSGSRKVLAASRVRAVSVR